MCYKQKCKVVSLNLAHPVEARTPATLSSKNRCSWRASTDVDRGTCPWPWAISASIDCHVRRGAERSASIFVRQKASRFRCSRSRYVRRSAVHAAAAAVATGTVATRLVRLDMRSRRRTRRLAFRHSWSNQGSEDQRRHVTENFGTSRSSTASSSVSKRCAKLSMS